MFPLLTSVGRQNLFLFVSVPQFYFITVNERQFVTEAGGSAAINRNGDEEGFVVAGGVTLGRM